MAASFIKPIAATAASVLMFVAGFGQKNDVAAGEALKNAEPLSLTDYYPLDGAGKAHADSAGLIRPKGMKIPAMFKEGKWGTSDKKNISTEEISVLWDTKDKREAFSLHRGNAGSESVLIQINMTDKTDPKHKTAEFKSVRIEQGGPPVTRAEEISDSLGVLRYRYSDNGTQLKNQPYIIVPETDALLRNRTAHQVVDSIAGLAVSTWKKYASASKGPVNTDYPDGDRPLPSFAPEMAKITMLRQNVHDLKLNPKGWNPELKTPQSSGGVGNNSGKKIVL
ncbi:MAG: hypothetical protein JWM96_912 [Alphaproteobacteria bacterium]|nr:hypothetical protein [Alphaproteobacteria bacterium]